MKPIAEFQEVTPGLVFWEGYNPEVKTDCSCCALVIAGSLIFVDPLRLAQPALDELTAGAEPRQIVLTNGNHARDAGWYAAHFGIPILAHREAIPELDLTEVREIREDEGILEGVRVMELPGAGPGEIALHAAMGGGVAVVGDALINLDSYGFTFLPEKYCTDARLMRNSLAKLAAMPFQVMTFSHGRPIIAEASRHLAALLDFAK